MNFSIRNRNPTPLELQYAELKKQSVIDQNNSPPGKGSKEREANEINDNVTLSSAALEADEQEQTRIKPSQPVTADEMQALRSQFNIYA